MQMVAQHFCAEYATLAFHTPKAAKFAVDALNHQGQFSAKIDKDHLPPFPIPYSESVSRTVYIGMINPLLLVAFLLGPHQRLHHKAIYYPLQTLLNISDLWQRFRNNQRLLHINVRVYRSFCLSNLYKWYIRRLCIDGLQLRNGFKNCGRGSAGP